MTGKLSLKFQLNTN